MNTIPATGESVSPTPLTVYEPRLFRVRLWTPENPFRGVVFHFKAPYGVYMNALQVLGRAMARGQITRLEFGPLSPRQIKALDENEPGWRKRLTRYEQVFEQIGHDYHLDWSA
jgi:hypothetical protein